MFSDEMKKVLKRETENSCVTYFEKEGGGVYPYTILPMESFASPEYFSAIKNGLNYMLKGEIKNSDAIMGIEAKAYLVTTLLSVENKIPHIAVRKRDYKTKDQIVIEQKKAYKGGQNLYCVGLNKLRELDRNNILIVEDMISSGGTLLTTLSELEKEGFNISGIGTVYERGDGVERIRDNGYDAKGLMRLDMENGKPIVSRFYGD